MTQGGLDSSAMTVEDAREGPGEPGMHVAGRSSSWRLGEGLAGRVMCWCICRWPQRRPHHVQIPWGHQELI